MADDTAQPRGVLYTDTADLPNTAQEQFGAVPAYPAQTRTYTVQSRNWDQTVDPTGVGYAATLTSWTRTELHN